MKPVLILMMCVCGGVVTAQERDVALYDYPQNHLKWFTIETDHFLVHFQEGNERPAKVTAAIAEEVYPDVTGLYGYEPDSKVSIVLNDRLDYSNGAAYFFDNKIEIWLPSLDTPFRGTHTWLRTVITHEFVHIVQIQAALKQNRRWPATYLQWLTYEDVRRPDVLYGYPDGIATLPFANLSMPAWLAEGTAQYDRAHLHYDHWDTHRDMLLRTRILAGQEFSLDQMGTFSSKTSIERETIYNHGFAFTHWMAETYGEDILRTITQALAQPGAHDVSEAIRTATGTDGRSLHNRWITDMRTRYGAALAGRTFTTTSMLEPEGFLNQMPIPSPDGTRIAYLSNKGDDNARLKLYIRNLQDGRETAVADLGATDGDMPTLSCGFHAKPVLTRIGGSHDFSPDGTLIAYVRIRETRFGESYSDIHIHTLGTNASRDRRITTAGRVQDVSWHPDGRHLIAVRIGDGTANLVQVALSDGTITPLTANRHGEQVYGPVVHSDGRRVLFSFSDAGPRDIRLLDLADSRIQTLKTHPVIDHRDASWNGDRILYSSDADGIFNIHELDPQTGESRQVTSVPGGAFQPRALADGRIVMSTFQWDGYKIALALPADAGDQPIYERPFDRNAFVMNRPDVNDRDTGIPDSAIRRYEDTFTSFSFFPAVRVDQYTKAYGASSDLLMRGRFGDVGRNLWRDTKAGVYVASREMIDRFSLFGGVMVGPGSRDGASISDIVSMDRDAFLIAEYRGLPFIRRSWSPTVSIELFNIRRNVTDGLKIEEFPCTACLPDTTGVDIAYDVWEGRISLISKLNRYSLLELAYAHSPYRVSTESFFSRELKGVIGGSTSRYFVGNTYSASYTFNLEQPYRHSDIAPQGIRATLRYQYQPSQLLDGYEIKGGALVPDYNAFRMHTVQAEVRYGFGLWDRKWRIHSRFHTHLNPNDEYFFLDYIGGFPGMRSYPYFALGGNTTWFGSLSWNVPIRNGITKQVRQFTLDKVWARVFAELGNAWDTPLAIGDGLKSGLGLELRASLNSHYLFPTKVFISGAYGLNAVDLRLPDSFITTTADNRVRYGREVLVNVGVLFDFDF
jgi:Tol biopolymer transport system component